MTATSAFLYWIPMFIVWSIVLAMIVTGRNSSADDRMSRGELIGTLLASTVPLINIIMAVVGIIVFFHSGPVQRWFSEKV